MIRSKAITKEQTDKVLSLFSMHTCVEIADIVGVTLHQVYEVRKRYNLTNKQNQIFVFNDLQKQILLGGKLGDGNFKKNGANYYYRESHADDEKEYLLWKINNFDENMLSKRGMYKIKKGGWNVQQLYGFSTKSSPVFSEYNNLTISETISKLDHRGLIMFMLDDGWISKHSKTGNFFISGGILTEQNLTEVCSQFEKYGINNVHTVGKKRFDISIPKENTPKLYDMATSFIPENIDIIQKKFYNTRYTII